MSRLINTEEFIKRIDHYPPDIRDIAKKELRYCKTVDAVPVVHGHWIYKWNPYFKVELPYCSVCEKASPSISKTDYCPHCGAVMDAEEFEEPEINPCRGCEDYDGYGRCKSNGGCGRTESQVESSNAFNVLDALGEKVTE